MNKNKYPNLGYHRNTKLPFRRVGEQEWKDVSIEYVFNNFSTSPEHCQILSWNGKAICINNLKSISLSGYQNHYMKLDLGKEALLASGSSPLPYYHTKSFLDGKMPDSTGLMLTSFQELKAGVQLFGLDTSKSTENLLGMNKISGIQVRKIGYKKAEEPIPFFTILSEDYGNFLSSENIVLSGIP